MSGCSVPNFNRKGRETVILFSLSFHLLFTGCILAELYTGYPLFPGEDEVEQFSCIMEILGLPPSDLVNASTRKGTFFGELTFS